jgi:ferredoxin
MTPFGIRKKLKALLGLGGGGSPAPQAPALQTYEVTFECPDGSNYTTTAKEGDSLVLAAGRGAQPISTGCTDGTCGTCRIDVLEGAESLTVADGHELKTKADVGVPDAQRLGCQSGVIGPGIRVKITNILGEEPIDP